MKSEDARHGLYSRIVFALAVSFLFYSPNARAGEKTLRGHVPAAVARLRPLGDLAGSKKLNLAIGLPLRNRPDLTNLLQQIYDPTSTNFHRYLTSAQFAAQFAPAESDYQAVLAFAQSHHLTVIGTHPNRTLVDVTGSVADIEKAFHIRLRTFQHPTEGRTFYAPDSEPLLDSSLPIQSVSGLNNYFLPHPMNRKPAPFSKTIDYAVTNYATGSGPRGNFIGKDFRLAYAPGVALTGSGQAVGLFELDGYFPGDIASYENLAGIAPVPLTNVFLDGYNGNPGSANDEVALDIDMAIAMAPGLSQVIVYQGFTPNDILNRMATDNQASQLSSSWSFSTATDPARAQIFQQFAAQGQSMFQASGDDGAWTGTIPTPSDEPLLTIVGGTSLVTTNGGAWSSESTWPDSGGGVSTIYSIPAWQQNVSTPANQGSTTMRNIPDVACLADSVIWIFANNGEQGAIGGTSAAAPLWAGFTALANQQAAATSNARVGFLNPAIYAIGQGSTYSSAFHDITTGNNLSAGSSNRFFAVPGYDLCTGWGSPTGSNLISALIAPPDPLLIAPASIVTSAGPAGGPFNPASQNYSLTTFGAAPVNWALSNSTPWLTVSPTSGTVATNLPANIVTASFNSAATNLAAGSYVATIWFTNLNNGFAQSRQFVLDIITPPVITSQPSNLTVLPGATATFTVGVAPNAQLAYQWLDNGTNLTNGGNISGAQTSALAIANVTSASAGTYSVIVSNALASVPSSSATLTVTSVTTPGISFATLYSFSGGSDGGNPNALLQTVNGVFYGTTQTGGANSLGSVFALPPASPPLNLYSFAGAKDGSHPQDALTLGPDGNLYGTTYDGGSADNGTVFKITTNGFLASLATFNITNGDLPYAGLTLASDGNFYGTTYQGGSAGHGSAFKMTPAGLLTTLVSFNDTNGGFPHASLIQGADGNLYGTTFKGGAINGGTVFKMSTNGLLTTLVTFDGYDSAFPYAALSLDESGNFYGTTAGGGVYNSGTIFKMTSAGALTNLYSFTGTNDGAHPFGGVIQGADGNFYGATPYNGAYGDGTVYRLTADGTLTPIVQFDGYNGANPIANLTQGADGNLYGTTQNGGANGQGVIFQISFSGPLQITSQPQSQTVYSGANIVLAIATTGATPVSYQWQANGTNLNDGGNLSGSTSRVLTIINANSNNAAVYSVIASNALGSVTSAPATIQVIVSAPEFVSQPTNQTVPPQSTVTFSASVVGSLPLSYQWQENGTNLTDGGNVSGSTTAALTLTSVTEANNGTYSLLVSNALGTTNSSPATLTVIPVSALGTRFATLHSFSNGADGSRPSGLALGADGSLYGTTSFGGAYHNGSIFKVDSAGVVTTAASFIFSTNGSLPSGGVTLGLDGNLYGVTQYGGINEAGNVFRLTPGGSLTSIYSFTGGADGNTPIAPLLRGADGAFYGSTQLGGYAGAGNIFRITTNGVLTLLYSFNGTNDGGDPTNGLTQGVDGNFYGVTENGGASGVGCIFKLTTNGVFSTVYSFTGMMDGSFPNGPLAQGSDGALYGTTQHSTLSHFQFYGTVFKVTTNGSLTTLYILNSNDGHYPAAGVIQGGDGNFYGAIQFGGTVNNNGTIFYITPGGSPTTLVNFDGADEGAHPVTPITQGADGNFYGTTSTGGPGGYGTVYRIGFTNAPQITAQPQSQSAATGATINFRVAAIGSPILAYQWQENGTNLTDGGNISGSTNRVLALSNIVTNEAGNYSVIVSNSISSVTSSVATLTITASAPAIVSAPIPQTVLPGATATFNVSATGSQPLFYQWQKNGTNLNDGGNISGSAGATLTLVNVSPADAAAYSVTVSNTLGSITTTAVSLTVINVTTPGTTLANLYSFGGANDGDYPNGLTADTNGVLYGTARLGGVNGFGTIFKITPDNIFSQIYSFSNGEGIYPEAALALNSDGNLYGTTYYGGTQTMGAIFGITTNGFTTDIYSCAPDTNGAYPVAALTSDGAGNFYGTTTGAGSNNFGVVFRYTPNAGLHGIYSFTGGADGGQPQTALAKGSDGNFYGTTGVGNGTIFRITTNGALTTLHSFNSTDGASPNGLTLGPGGNFYGTTDIGGSNGAGTFFKITPAGNFSSLYCFLSVTNGTNFTGANPQAALALGSDGNLYGTTANGGVYGDGTIFQITMAGALTTLAWFDGPNGAHPASALVQNVDGNFYGATSAGGTANNGAIFRVGISLQPLLENIAQTNGLLTFTFSAVAQRRYQVQYATNLISANWIDLGTPYTATNNRLSISDAASPDHQRFYRVLLLPQN
jgi:uncharacterized repeat protein (TIGR03803 family)